MTATLNVKVKVIIHTQISYFNYYMTDFNFFLPKMINMRLAFKLVRQLSLEIYVNVTVPKKNNI